MHGGHRAAAHYTIPHPPWNASAPARRPGRHGGGASGSGHQFDGYVLGQFFNFDQREAEEHDPTGRKALAAIPVILGLGDAINSEQARCSRHSLHDIPLMSSAAHDTASDTRMGPAGPAVSHGPVDRADVGSVRLGLLPALDLLRDRRDPIAERLDAGLAVVARKVTQPALQCCRELGIGVSAREPAVADLDVKPQPFSQEAGVGPETSTLRGEHQHGPSRLDFRLFGPSGRPQPSVGHQM